MAERAQQAPIELGEDGGPSRRAECPRELGAIVIDCALENNAAEGPTSVTVARFGGKSEGESDDERATT
jgi:hypothetical protein